MKKKTTEISINTSSGAEKVENIEKEVKKEDGKTEKKSVVKKTEKENKAADERVKAALKRKAEKENNGNIHQHLFGCGEG